MRETKSTNPEIIQLIQFLKKQSKEKDAGIKVSWEKNDFIMNIESTGALPPDRILQEATKILDKQLKEFEEQLKVEVP